jgi:hypothetical protein
MRPAARAAADSGGIAGARVVGLAGLVVGADVGDESVAGDDEGRDADEIAGCRAVPPLHPAADTTTATASSGEARRTR